MKNPTTQQKPMETNIDKQIHEILSAMLMARQEANFYIRLEGEVISFVKKEMGDYGETCLNNPEEPDDKELFEKKVALMKAQVTLNAMNRITALIKREADKSLRRDNELTERLKQFCKRHHIDWEEYLALEKEK